MDLPLGQLVADFADALSEIDISGARHKTYSPGIGPFGEAQAVRAALDNLRVRKPEFYSSAATTVQPDILIPDYWAIECKIIRPFGDNGKVAEHWSENVLHPYPGNVSALGDCLKLLNLSVLERKSVLILGFEHSPPQIPLEPAIRGFEELARSVLHVHLSPRADELRPGLIHPYHQQLCVYGYEVLGRLDP